MTTVARQTRPSAKRLFCKRLLPLDIFLEPVERDQAPPHLPEHRADKTIPTQHDKKHQTLDCVLKKTTRHLQTVPRRHGVELRTDKLHGQGLRLDWSDKPVREVGHADHMKVTSATFPT